MRRSDGSLDLPLLVLVLAVTSYAAMLASLWTGYLDPLFHDSDRYPRAIDFYSVYQSGDALMHGRSIYDWPPPSGVVPISFPFRYLPFMGYAIAVPFNALPPEAGYWCWVAVVQCMLVANAWLTYRLAPDRDWGLIAAALWFAFTPLYLEIYMGQWSFLMATLMLWSIAFILRGRPLLSAAPWAASLLVKPSSAMLAPIYVRLQAWRALAIAAVALVALNLPYFIVRPSDAREFWDINFGDYLTEPATRFDSFETGDLGLLGLLQTAWLSFDDTATEAPAWLVLAIVAAIVALSLLATFRRGVPDVVALFAVWSAAYFLVYDDVWEHHYVMLLPALVLLVALRPGLRLLGLVVWLLIALPTPYGLFEGWLSDRPAEGALLAPELFWPEWARVVYHGVKVVPVLALWGWLCVGLISPGASRQD